MKTYLLLLGLGGLVLICGCATQMKDPVPVLVDYSQLHTQSPNVQNTVAMVFPNDNSPAVLTAGYEHVLARKKSDKEKSLMAEALQKLPDTDFKESDCSKLGTAVGSEVGLEGKTSKKETLIKAKREKPSQKSQGVSPQERAWKRFCDNGEGMTDEDWKIVGGMDFQIPAKFIKDCLPPK